MKACMRATLDFCTFQTHLPFKKRKFESKGQNAKSRAGFWGQNAKSAGRSKMLKAPDPSETLPPPYVAPVAVLLLTIHHRHIDTPAATRAHSLALSPHLSHLTDSHIRVYGRAHTYDIIQLRVFRRAAGGPRAAPLSLEGVARDSTLLRRRTPHIYTAARRTALARPHTLRAVASRLRSCHRARGSCTRAGGGARLVLCWRRLVQGIAPAAHPIAADGSAASACCCCSITRL